MPEDRQQIQTELQAMRQKADLQVTSHSFLRDHYLSWGQRLSIYTLLSSAILLFFTMASDDFIQRTLGLPADGFKWAEGGAAFLTFCLSLVDLAWNPASKSKAHDQAVAHYLRMNYEIRNLLGGGPVTREKVRWLQEEYLDAADLPRIPEGQSLSLKRHHLQKLAIAQALEQNPHQSLWLLPLKLWWKAPAAAPAPVPALRPPLKKASRQR
jgi:hypothetical protein